MKFLQRGILIFGIAFAGNTSAQTTVCSGDSVVLILNEYKQGEISWKQSPNGVTWSSASGTVSNDSLSFTATNTYYYRAIVTDGTCSPFYSDTTLVIVNPTPPIAKPATGITQTFFTANWSAVAGATDYFLDVATDAAFTSFVPGYKNIDVGSADTTYLISGLTCLTPYYYRVRDTSDGCPQLSSNSNTITVITDSCPPPTNCGIITDSRDGKTYKTIVIGTQCWMAQNLNVGMAIPGAVQQTNNTIIEKYCYNYGGTTADSSLCNTYGGLYLWDEMMNYGASVSGDKGPKGICPTDWHIPTDYEWTTLETYLGGAAVAGRKLKDTTKWTFSSDTTKGTNSRGFSALPSGFRYDPALFGSVGDVAYFWTAMEFPANVTTDAWYRSLYYTDAKVARGIRTKALYGFSVRCVKD